MTARLLARAGPLEGADLPLPEGELTIGRDSTNALCLGEDTGVSRRHCVIRGQNLQFTVRDLDSHNRTYVNDVEVQEHPLEHGDEIRIGHSVFVFLTDGQAGPQRRARVDLDEGQRVTGSTMTLNRRDVWYLQPDAFLESGRGAGRNDGRSRPLPVGLKGLASSEIIVKLGLEGVDVTDADREKRSQADRHQRIVKSILGVCRAVVSVHVLQDLQTCLVQSILDAIPADRAALLLLGNDADEFASALHWVRQEGERPSFRIPRAVARAALTEGTALCVNDALDDTGTEPSETIRLAHVTSIMAVPIIASDRVLGAIYVDVTNPAIRFGEDHLQLLTGIAEVSAAPLANALKVQQLERDNERLLVQLAGNQPLVGVSERMRAVHRFIMRAAPSDATVLVSGASGTGKELVARAIHRNSLRSGKPFVAINCAAIVETLIESEFFGHEKGAFTGAFAQKKGKLEEADCGTVFLDEIGELALPLQAKLLRVLQEREFERVGGTRPIKVNIRVIAATNRDLEQDVRGGRFRQDLYYRLNVVSVTLPDLRERREDIPVLAKHFLHKHAKTCTRRIVGFSEEALSCLAVYDWPGNVRELENAIERAIVLGTTDEILPDDLPESIAENGEPPSASGTKFHETIREIKKQLVTKALGEANGSYVEAARRLGLHPNNLHRLAKTLDLKS